jgi:hypothetical protein
VSEEDKRRFDAVFSLFDLAWRQFNLRRDFEFKVTLTLWTALAIGIAGVLNVSHLAAISIPLREMLPVAMILFALHALWCWGIGQAQNGDRRIAIGYERTLHELSQTSFDDVTKKQLLSLQRRMGLLKNWTYIFQLGVTGMLLAILVISSFRE